MALDGLIILDSSGRPIIQSGFRLTSTAYPLLHVDALNHALETASQPDDVDPVLYVQSYSTTGFSSACCHVRCNDIRILAPVSGDVDPLVAFAFMQTFIDILKEYFGVVNATTMKENFDVVYQLLEETLDAGGHPLTTSTNALREIVLPPSLLTKLLSVAGANITPTINSGYGHGSTSGPFSSPIPWRRAGVRYTNNEIYIDVIEELRAIVGRNGTALSSITWGKLEANVKLSGTPDCSMTFSNAQVMTDWAFHSCVRLQRWNRDKVLSFIPPDGRFVLAEYRYLPPAASTGASSDPSTNLAFSSALVAKDLVPVPITLKPIIELEENGGTFDLTLTSRLTTRAMETVTAELLLGEGAGGVKCIVGRGSGGFGRGLSSLESGGNISIGASWAFDAKKRVLRWEIPSVPPASSWTLKGSFATISIPRPSRAIHLTFEIGSHTFSALKIDQLRVSGETNKPYKGVRGRSTADIEWRW
ncbi:Mu homology domain containing protein [Amanita muscaria]